MPKASRKMPPRSSRISTSTSRGQVLSCVPRRWGTSCAAPRPAPSIACWLRGWASMPANPGAMVRPAYWSAIRKTRSREPRSPTSSDAPSRSILSWSSLRASWRSDCAGRQHRTSHSQHPPRLQRRGQGAVVEVVELAADRHTLSEPRELDPAAGDALGEIMRGGLALDRGIERQDELLTGLEAPDQALDVEILGPHPVERRQGSAEHVVTASEGSGAFQCPEISKVFDDADRPIVALRVAADRAGQDGIEIAANWAGPHRLGRLGECRCERLEQALPPLEEVQRRAPRRARAEPRKLGEELDQRIELGHRFGARAPAPQCVGLRTAALDRPAIADRRSAFASPVRHKRIPFAGH